MPSPSGDAFLVIDNVYSGHDEAVDADCAKDVPINLHSFHYITRQVLLKWWKNELVGSR